jgi:Tfp pilus assembly protein PilV
MIEWPVQQHPSAQRGLSLLELLLALLLTAVPVVAAQRLMFRTADSARFVADQMLARQAALSSYERIIAFYTQGLWPANVLQSGVWWVALNTTVNEDSTDALGMQCVNNWCSMNQWAAFEVAAMGCALRGHFVHHEDPLVGTTGCQTAAPLDESFVGLSDTTELLTEQPIETHSLLAFEAEMHAVDNLGIVVRWPKAPVQQAASTALTSVTTPSVDALTEAMTSDWYEVVVGQGP